MHVVHCKAVGERKARRVTIKLWPKQIKGNYGRFLKEAAGGPHGPRLGSYPVMEAGRRGPSVAERVARPEVELSQGA